MSTPFTPIKTAKITWRDGLPHSSTYEDIYFSSSNGLQEAMHVFVEGNRLIERWQGLAEDAVFTIGETGFGTGLNFLLAWSIWDRTAPPNARLHFITCEQHPLSLTDLRQCLALWPELTHYAEMLFATYPVLTPGFHQLELDNGRVTLHLMLGDALSCYQERLLCGDAKLEQSLRRDVVDAWFLDGFSPQKNQDMWTEQLFGTIAQLSKHGTTLSTFSVAGFVQRGLRSAGFTVAKKPGYAQKREMLIGHWHQLPPRLFKPKTPWHVATQQCVDNKQAIVVGAGLAGCCVAYSLARRGWHVTVLDSHSTVAQGASGNHRTILFPMTSAYRAPLTEYMLTAFLYASRFYQQCIKRWSVGDFSGILQFSRATKKPKAEADLAKWLLAYPELGRLVDAQQASELSGVECHSGGVFIPNTGWIDSPLLCERLIQQAGIRFIPNTSVDSLYYDAGQWSIAGHTAPVVVLANGFSANQFIQTRHLSIQAIRGQMTEIKASEHSSKQKIPLCGDGHIVPQHGGVHAIGATYGPMLQDKSDDAINVATIQNLPAQLNISNQVMSHWEGIRGATTDHLPLVGAIADASLFVDRFKSLHRDRNRWVASGGDYLQGLFIASGFASRGVTTIPISAEYLAGLINNDPSCLPRHLVQAISPARCFVP